MFFIGVVSDSKKFEDLKNIVQIYMHKNDISLININKKSIENLTNIRFDVIILLDSLNKIENQYDNLERICKNVKYMFINSDINIKSNILSNIEANIITFGLNHKATVTFSSITDERMLISVQRDFKNLANKVIEVGEYEMKITAQQRTYIYEILITFIIKQLYN